VFNSIVVAVDLVSNVHRALPVARSLADLGNLPIQLLTVSTPWMAEEIDTYALERLAEHHGISPLSCIIDHHDDAGWAIARHVNNGEGSLLVMATTAKAPVRRHFLGTVTESVLTRVDGPVLLLGPQVPATCSLDSSTVVACVDETDAADAALPVIADWVLWSSVRSTSGRRARKIPGSRLVPQGARPPWILDGLPTVRSSRAS
jgi:nucleotide-binding universal stress UspA family protein